MKILVFAVVEEMNRFLMIRESSGKWKDKWYFPGGKIEGHETIEEAAIREVKEEAGLQIMAHGIIYVEFIKGASGGDRVDIYLSATIIEGALKKNADHHSQKAAWKSIAEIHQLDLRDKTVLKIIESYSHAEALPLSHFHLKE